MTLKDLLFNEITESGLLDDKLIETIEEEEVISSKNIGSNSEKLKEFAINYLKEKNMDLTQENYEMALKFIQNNSENGIFHNKQKKKIVVNKLKDFNEEELKDLLQLCLLKEYQKLRKFITKNSFEQKYEYLVETIQDSHAGSTNIREMSRIINLYAGKGWRVKSIFSNEIGKNSFSTAVGVVSSGVNSTIDEIIIVFEREVSA